MVKGGIIYLDLTDVNLATTDPTTVTGLFEKLTRANGKPAYGTITFGGLTLSTFFARLIDSFGNQVLTGSAYDGANNVLVSVELAVSDEDAVTPTVNVYAPEEI